MPLSSRRHALSSSANMQAAASSSAAATNQYAPPAQPASSSVPAAGAGAGAGAGLASLAAVEARLSGQVQQAAVQHDAHQAMMRAGMAAAPPALPTLPLASASAPLRPATVAATLAGQQGGGGGGSGHQGGGGGGSMMGGAELHALEWADAQFQRAGVHPLPAVDRAHAVPIQNLGMQQRLRHAQMLSVVERLREGQQHIFLEQFNQSAHSDRGASTACTTLTQATHRFPNVDRHSADEYSRIWHAFKHKDEEAEHIIAKLNGVCESLDTLNRHAHHSHS